jgi:hypothetical protein
MSSEENKSFAFGRSKMNKVWQKPKLIILYRGRPEESVLLGCKIAAAGAASGSVAVKVNDCSKNPCDPCNILADT